jgi:hypothetical protein
VVEHAGRISGYATDLAFFAHAVGESLYTPPRGTYLPSILY